MKGFLLVDKPGGVTSFDVVRDVRRASGVRKVGHAGTLDPLATGLLVVAIGEATKLLEYFIGCDKEYEVLAKFGYRSDSYDADGEIEEVDSSLAVEGKQIDIAIKEEFLGKIQQMPPKYSALKIGGKRACDIVREGGEVELKAREVSIQFFEVIDYDWPLVRFRVKCGSGTYVRSLVHDLGEKLGTGAFVEELRRNYVGPFEVNDAVPLEKLSNKIEQGLIPLERAVACFSKRDLREEEYGVLKGGGLIDGVIDDKDFPLMAFYDDQLVGVLAPLGEREIKMKKQIQFS
jgi:tRNA pseudouridine55 synthase